MSFYTLLLTQNAEDFIAWLNFSRLNLAVFHPRLTMLPQSDQAAINRILHFWFGDHSSAHQIASEKTELWWSKNKQIDAQITDLFAATTTTAAEGKLTHWEKSPHGLLALILCTDQFPRNMHRDSSRAFAYDGIALQYAKTCINNGSAQQLLPIQQVFAYIPFEHSENLADQQTSITLYQTLADAAEGDEAKIFKNFLNFAHKHLEIIQRFGRFPHRNQVLSRHSTNEEQSFLKQPGSSF